MDISILRNVQDLKRIKSNKSMFLLNMNVSLASFNTTTINLVYLDPYNNTFGEEDWFVVFCTAILCILSIVLIFLMLGIVIFVNYGIDIEDHKLLDDLMSFGMITCIIMLLPTAILMTYRNVLGPLPSIFATNMLLSIVTVWTEQFC